MVNNLKVIVLMAGLTALFVVVGGALGGQQGMLIAFLLAGALNLFAYFNSGNAALRAFKARVVSRDESPDLYDMVDRLRQRAGLPMPKVAIAPHQQPNAFASGRNPKHAVVCVTEGILQLVDRDELEGVLAHEIGHIKNGDILIQTLTATVAGAVGMLSRFGMVGAAASGGRTRVNPLIVILAPLAAMLIQFAISRQREFGADRVGAELSGRPLDLASALQKLNAAARRVPMRIVPSYAPMAQVDPLQAYGRGVLSLFSTHPPVAERVARLEAMARDSLAAPAAA
ncbi:MAG: zinc metalloprotease HtpX [Betaproteobacteria bacterium]|jgi:heat shock protein HtpX|nr:zinc metalloprotease HtpX [Betaproteobacteria bacterium]